MSHTKGARVEKSGAAEIQDDLGVVQASNRGRCVEGSDPGILEPEVGAQPIRCALLAEELEIDHGLSRLNSTDKSADALVSERLKSSDCWHQPFAS